MNLPDLLDSAGGKKSNAGQSLDNSGSDLLGSLTGGDGFDMGDVLNLARKFFWLTAPRSIPVRLARKGCGVQHVTGPV